MKKTLISTILATALISTMIATVANASVTEDNILINLNSSVETNIEEIDYASMISSIQLPVLVENLKTYMEENPNLTDEEINNYFKNLIIQNYDESLVALDNISMYAYDYANALPIVSSRLGTNEKKVFNSNPAKGVLVLSNAQAAITMTSQHWKILMNIIMIMQMHLDILFGMHIMHMIVEYLTQNNLQMHMKKIILMMLLRIKWICLIML